MASDGSQPLVMNGKLAGYNRDNQSGGIPGISTVGDSYGDLRTAAGGRISGAQAGGGGRANTLQGGVVPTSDREFYTRALYGSNNKAHEKTVFNENGIPVSFSNATGARSRCPPCALALAFSVARSRSHSCGLQNVCG